MFHCRYERFESAAHNDRRRGPAKNIILNIRDVEKIIFQKVFSSEKTQSSA